MMPLTHQGGDMLCPQESKVRSARKLEGTVFIAPITFAGNGLASIGLAKQLPLDPGRWARPQSTVEKNLLLFQHGKNMHYVYRIFPHVVYEVAAAEGSEPKRFVGDSRILSDLLIRPEVADDGLIAHGGAAPIRLSLPLRSNVTNLFIASFHVTSSKDGTDYAHHLYIFEAERFDIVAVSGRLPLVEQPGKNRGTFISSILESEQGGFIIGYGSGDVESRILSISHAMFRQLFAHSIGLKKYVTSN
jgi:hypothetical protein